MKARFRFGAVAMGDASFVSCLIMIVSTAGTGVGAGWLVLDVILPTPSNLL